MSGYAMTSTDNGKGVDVARAATKSPSGSAFLSFRHKVLEMVSDRLFFLIFIEKVVTLYF
jgi:hypothetical protein